MGSVNEKLSYNHNKRIICLYVLLVCVKLNKDYIDNWYNINICDYVNDKCVCKILLLRE